MKTLNKPIKSLNFLQKLDNNSSKDANLQNKSNKLPPINSKMVNIIKKTIRLPPKIFTKSIESLGSLSSIQLKTNESALLFPPKPYAFNAKVDQLSSKSTNISTTTISKEINSYSKLKEENPINQIIPIKQKTIEFDFNKDLKLQLDAPYQYYRLDSINPQAIPIKISLKTKDQDLDINTINRPSIDLICVVDISGSMYGHKLDLVKQTLKYIISILKDSDRLALITFNHEGNILFSLHTVSKANNDMFNQVFDSLNNSGSTSINSGMKLAIELINSRISKNPITSVFLLSDGCDDDGINALDNIKNTINSCKINEDFILNAFGFGSDHDANLMREISRIKGGNFYFIDNLSHIDECFVDALGMLFSVILKDIEFTVKVNNTKPLHHMRVRKTYGDMWSYDEAEGFYRIQTKIFTLGMKKDYICELKLPACNLSMQDSRQKVLMTVEMEGLTIDGKVIEKKAELSIGLLSADDQMPEDKKLNIEVLVNHLRVKGAEKMEIARNLADANHFNSARKLLKTMLITIEDSGCKFHPAILILKKNVETAMILCQPTKYHSEGGRTSMVTYANTNMNQQSDPTSSVGDVNNYYGTSIQTNMNHQLKVSKKNVFSI